MEVRPEQRCEATITYETVQEPVYPKPTGAYEGFGIGLEPGGIEQPGIEKVMIACKRCSIAPITFQEKGKGPYGAFNKSRSGARAFIATNCEKFQPFKDRGVSEPDGDFHPKL